MKSELTPYAEVNIVLELLLKNVKKIFKNQFVGMYLYGSLASGDFDVETSDIDFVVVTTDSISNDTFLALKAMHEHLLAHNLKWIEKLEGSYLSQTAFRKYDASDATAWPTLNEKDLYLAAHESHWVIQRYIVREQGVILAGPAPKSLIDPVQPDDLRKAVIGYLNEWWLPMVTDSSRLQSSEYQAYAILSMCRILYTLRYGEVVSKPVAARWAQKELGRLWETVIEEALSWRKGEDLNFLQETQELIAYTVERGKRV